MPAPISSGRGWGGAGPTAASSPCPALVESPLWPLLPTPLCLGHGSMLLCSLPARPCAPPVQSPSTDPQHGPCTIPGQFPGQTLSCPRPTPCPPHWSLCWATSPCHVPHSRAWKFPSKFPSRFPAWTVPQMRGRRHQGDDSHAAALHWPHCPWHTGTLSPARVRKSCSKQSSGVGSPQITLFPLTAMPQELLTPAGPHDLAVGGWLGHRHGVALLSLPVPACFQGMSLLIHHLGPNCYLHSGTQFTELREEGGGTGPTGPRAGPGGCTASRLQGKDRKHLPGWGGEDRQLSRH